CPIIGVSGRKKENSAPITGVSGRNSAPSLVSGGGIVPQRWCQWVGRNSAVGGGITLVSSGGEE
ncbi:unnamed protein product, partial [Staurois parvus]